MEAISKACSDKEEAEERCLVAANEFFLLYVNILSEDAWYQWDKLVASQDNRAPWTDPQSRKHQEAHKNSYYAFEDCITLHLQTLFSDDVTEQECLCKK